MLVLIGAGGRPGAVADVVGEDDEEVQLLEVYVPQSCWSIKSPR